MILGLVMDRVINKLASHLDALGITKISIVLEGPPSIDTIETNPQLQHLLMCIGTYRYEFANCVSFRNQWFLLTTIF